MYEYIHIYVNILKFIVHMNEYIDRYVKELGYILFFL